MKKLGIAISLTLLILLCAQPTKAAEKETKSQTVCPIMGGAINSNVYYDYKGMRIYACCSGCVKQIAANPQGAIEKIKSMGEEPAAISTVCKKCGEIKGSPNCCNPNVSKCSMCGMHKGSPGCCPMAKAKAMCKKCGEIKGSLNCCNPNVSKCAMCGMHKGSPGCCPMTANKSISGCGCSGCCMN